MQIRSAPLHQNFLRAAILPRSTPFVHCLDVALESTDIAKAITEYVSHAAIETVVLGTPSRSGFMRKFKADVPSTVSRGAPDFCTVYGVSKGKVYTMRNASRPAPFASTLLDQIQNQQNQNSPRVDSSEALYKHVSSITERTMPVKPRISGGETFRTSFTGSTHSLDDMESGMRRLKLELKQTMDLYNAACREALTAKRKATELNCWRIEEERRFPVGSNMVLLLGACPEYGILVYEYMAKGSLEDRLFKRGNTPALSWQIRLVPTTSENVTQYHMTSAAGTFCYIDPEYQQTGKLGVKSDVYSLGILLLQVITAKPPMDLTHIVEQAIENEALKEILDSDVRDWPIEETLCFAKLALQCAELRRKDRPDLGTEVLPELNRLRDLAEEKMNSSHQPNLNNSHQP
ncbi:hypothetical protein D5086_024361 [Populus alba]|uniref:Uncharacterized protein n=1 Tax=Populus alba TaxID=43335 RepID=A0ACC4B583_POPAL